MCHSAMKTHSHNNAKLVNTPTFRELALLLVRAARGARVAVVGGVTGFGAGVSSREGLAELSIGAIWSRWLPFGPRFVFGVAATLENSGGSSLAGVCDAPRDRSLQCFLGGGLRSRLRCST